MDKNPKQFETAEDSIFDELFAAFARLKSPEEFRRFLTDLCTPAELHSMAERWRVARLLDLGLPYRVINEQTGVSTATITRVARSITYGARGYQILLNEQKGVRP